MKIVLATLAEWFGIRPPREPAHRHAWGPWSEIADLAEMASFNWGPEIVGAESDAFKESGFYGYMQYRTCTDPACGLSQQHPVCEPVENVE